MRTPAAIITGVVVGCGLAVAAFVVHDRWRDPAVELPPVIDRPVGVAAAAPASDIEQRPVAQSARPSAGPTTPVYGPMTERPNAIYRCVSNGATTYTNEPCRNGTVVDETGAMSGYDSRPSQRLERLVSQGRVIDAPVVPTEGRRRAAAVETFDCANWRRQIRDLDAEALRPHAAAWLDELRQRRRDVSDSMARNRC